MSKRHTSRNVAESSLRLSGFPAFAPRAAVEATTTPRSFVGAATAVQFELAPCGRITPQRLSRERNVFGCRPSRRAAPCSPSMTQRVSISTCSTYERSTSAMVRGVWPSPSCGRGVAASGGGRREIGQGVQVQHVAAREHDRALDDVLELAHVARPLVSEQPPHRLGRDILDALARLAGVTPQERANQQRDVVDALAQRRQRHREDVEPVVEILAELPRAPPSAAGCGWSPR